MKKRFSFALMLIVAMLTVLITNAAEDRKHFEGHTYQRFDESLTWDEANAACMEAGGHLVTITSEEEQDFIESLMEEGNKKQYWIGMRTSGGPTWVNGEAYDYSNWDRGEPNNQHKTNSSEDYVHIYNVANPAVYGSKRFKWNDMFGDNTYPGEEDNFSLEHVGYICEWDNLKTSYDSDVSEWSSPEMEEAYDAGLVPENLVGKDLTEPVSRAEFSAIAVELYESLSGENAKPAKTPFVDITGDENEDYIKKAYDLNVVVGVSETEFAPDAGITREQLATMLCRTIKKYKFPEWSYATDADYYLDSEGVKKFADDGDISGYAKPSVYYMVKMGIINGVSETHFAPRNTNTEQEASGYASATREQAIALSLRTYKLSDLWK